jgi:uncharacterized surface protein with fasciclin (FAS1) repeats
MNRILVIAALLSGLVLAPQGHAQGPDRDIVSTALAEGSFSTLAAALEAAELVSVLQGDGPFTVFAPTDEAFAKLPEGSIEALLNDREQLTRVLMYHVVPGEVTSSEVVGMSEAQTAAGLNASIEVRDGSVYVGGAQVITPDVMASNGVIHVIDTVMLPPTG